MVDVVVRQPAEGDVEKLVANLRPADRAELEASGFLDFPPVIQHAIAMSHLCWVAEANGELACIFGVGPVSLLSDSGVPWMLGTTLIDRYPSAFIKHARVYIRAMIEAYPHLTNAVDTRNTRAVRWLKRAGFKLHEPEPHPMSGVLFHRFEMGG